MSGLLLLDCLLLHAGVDGRLMRLPLYGLPGHLGRLWLMLYRLGGMWGRLWLLWSFLSKKLHKKSPLLCLVAALRVWGLRQPSRRGVWLENSRFAERMCFWSLWQIPAMRG